MGRIISICNQKGGVGKSSLAVNLPVFLAGVGKKVLLVDFDSQASATLNLGFSPRELPFSIYHTLMENITPESIIQKSPFFGYDIMPSSPDLAGATIELVKLKDREFKLSNILDKVKNNYDFIFIDSPPNLGLLTINALVASNQVLIPVQCEYLALEGLEQLLETIKLVKNNLDQDLKIGGIILTMYSKKNRLSREIAKKIRRKFSEYVFDAVIPRAVVLGETPMVKKTILQHAPKSKASRAYQELAKEILSKIEE